MVPGTRADAGVDDVDNFPVEREAGEGPRRRGTEGAPSVEPPLAGVPVCDTRRILAFAVDPDRTGGLDPFPSVPVFTWGPLLSFRRCLAAEAAREPVGVITGVEEPLAEGGLEADEPAKEREEPMVARLAWDALVPCALTATDGLGRPPASEGASTGVVGLPLWLPP